MPISAQKRRERLIRVHNTIKDEAIADCIIKLLSELTKDAFYDFKGEYDDNCNLKQRIVLNAISKYLARENKLSNPVSKQAAIELYKIL